VLIDEGRLIYDGEIERIKDQYGTHRTLVVELCEAYPGSRSRAPRSNRGRATSSRLRFDRQNDQRRSADPARRPNAIA
jgi:ABC-type uncharacterized transport system ATPase subunit